MCYRSCFCHALDCTYHFYKSVFLVFLKKVFLIMSTTTPYWNMFIIICCHLFHIPNLGIMCTFYSCPFPHNITMCRLLLQVCSCIYQCLHNLLCSYTMKHSWMVILDFFCSISPMYFFWCIKSFFLHVLFNLCIQHSTVLCPFHL